ncbi:hypothetical protein M404DRAFT_487348 [Pisolithus tinctorius Marx 270]|uniref:Uncharacterized protein n=1 Tax=Pisolithus tinctorius Marx 270 TaxID=870435 RepID=A0A0C3MXJ6_PISTI|nr:hypothetical protein M404DRAFT_487348 [Pisolithus tinctorius Marx 270]
MSFIVHFLSDGRSIQSHLGDDIGGCLLFLWHGHRFCPTLNAGEYLACHIQQLSREVLRDISRGGIHRRLCSVDTAVDDDVQAPTQPFRCECEGNLRGQRPKFKASITLIPSHSQRRLPENICKQHQPQWRAVWSPKKYTQNPN